MKDDIRKAMGRNVPLTKRVGYAVRYNLSKVFAVQRAACHPVLRRLAPEYEGACDHPLQTVLGQNVPKQVAGHALVKRGG